MALGKIMSSHPHPGCCFWGQMMDNAELRTAPLSPALDGQQTARMPVLVPGCSAEVGLPTSCPACFPSPHCPFPEGLHSDMCSSEASSIPLTLPATRLHTCPGSPCPPGQVTSTRLGSGCPGPQDSAQHEPVLGQHTPRGSCTSWLPRCGQGQGIRGTGRQNGRGSDQED